MGPGQDQTRACQVKTTGRIAQSVACLTADPGVASLILAQSHTFAEIDHEFFSMAIVLPSACCQLQVKVCAQGTG